MIPQEDMSGCAVACVAALLGESYTQALLHFEHPEYASLRGYYAKEVVDALHHAGIEAELKYVKPYMRQEIEKLGTIVFCERDPAYPNGHYLLKTTQGWMNPWANFPSMTVRAAVQDGLPSRPQYAIFSRV